MGITKLIKSLVSGVPQERLSDKKKNVPDSIEGYDLAEFYENIPISLSRTFAPKNAEVGSRVVLFQEPTNAADSRAVRVMLVPQRIPFAYLYRGKIQDIANSYLDNKDKIVARISSIDNPYGKDEVTIDIAFFKKR